MEAYLAALERELEGYERVGKQERAAEVRNEIARVRKQGGVETTSPEPEAETAVPPKPRRRTRREDSA